MYYIIRRDAVCIGHYDQNDGYEQSRALEHWRFGCNGFMETLIEVEPIEIHCGVAFVAKTDGLGRLMDKQLEKDVENL